MRGAARFTARLVARLLLLHAAINGRITHAGAVVSAPAYLTSFSPVSGGRAERDHSQLYAYNNTDAAVAVLTVDVAASGGDVFAVAQSRRFSGLTDSALISAHSTLILDSFCTHSAFV